MGQLCPLPPGVLWPFLIPFLLLPALVLTSEVQPKVDCTTGTVTNCDCVDVPRDSLACQATEMHHWTFESQLKADSETTEMTLKCMEGGNETVLDDLQAFGVDRSASFKMVGCSDETSEDALARRCTPIHSHSSDIGFLKRFWNFISFSYTYTSTTTLRQLDLVGCLEVQEPENLMRVKTLMRVDAIRLFGFEGVDRLTTFVKFLYYGFKQFQVRIHTNDMMLMKLEPKFISLFRFLWPIPLKAITATRA